MLREANLLVYSNQIFSICFDGLGSCRYITFIRFAPPANQFRESLAAVLSQTDSVFVISSILLYVNGHMAAVCSEISPMFSRNHSCDSEKVSAEAVHSLNLYPGSDCLTEHQMLFVPAFVVVYSQHVSNSKQNQPADWP